MPPPRHVLVTDAPSLPLAVASACVAAYGLDPAHARVVTGAALDAAGGVPGLPANAVDALVSLARDPARWHAGAPLAAVAAALKPGAVVVFASLLPVDDDESASAAPSAAAAAANTSDVLVAGLVDAKPHAAAASPPAGVAPGSASLASKPAWTRGASFGLKSRKQNAQKENAAPRNHDGSSAWKVLGADDDALELMDEDALLDEDEIRAGADAAARAKADGGDCSTKATACKNCSCGRAEVEATGKELTAEEKKAFKSACGNCYLGDAFRCAGCPMLGQPASAPPGQSKVTVDMADDLP